ncbi:MAG: hypothetical protein AAGF04_02740 [Chlamydiota bacterium]
MTVAQQAPCLVEGMHQAPHKHRGAYGYTLGAPVGVALSRGINATLDLATSIQVVLMLAVAHSIQVTINELETVKKQELDAEDYYIGLINNDDDKQAPIDEQKLNAVKAKFTNVENTLSDAQNRETNLQKTGADNGASLIGDANEMLKVLQGLVA